MLYIYCESDHDITAVSDKFVPGYMAVPHFARNLYHTEHIAAQISAITGEKYIAVDAGEHCSPRFNVIKAPKIGDEVSYAFNGDYYPCGTITKISPTMKKISTSEGKIFMRRGQSGAWLYGRTWAMVRGHHSEKNPQL